MAPFTSSGNAFKFFRVVPTQRSDFSDPAIIAYYAIFSIDFQGECASRCSVAGRRNLVRPVELMPRLRER